MPHWLPKKTLHALEAVIFIAQQAQHEPVSGKDISEQLGFPARYLEQLMQRLVRTHILRGIRGPHGGYVLARERRRISIRDVIEALAESEEDSKAPPFCSDFSPAILQPVLEGAYDGLLKSLQDVSLEQLCKQIRKQPSAPQAQGAQKKSDFVI